MQKGHFSKNGLSTQKIMKTVRDFTRANGRTQD